MSFKMSLENSTIPFENNSETQTEFKEPRLKCRHMIVFVGFCLYFLTTAYRMNTSVSIVAMVNNSAVSRETKATSESCSNLIPNVTASEEDFYLNKREDGDFDWSPEIQGYVLGSYFLGYMISQIPTGRLVERFGGKWFLLASALVPAVCNFLIPPIAWLSVPVLIALLILRGFAQALIQPALFVLTSNWFPKMERGILLAFMTSGAAVGSCLGSLFSGFLCASLGRWPSSFHTFGAMGLVATALVAFFVHESPQDHPKISEAELHYILSNQESKLSKRRSRLPWRQILTSVPVYALLYASFGQVWAISQFLIVHSTFLGTILHYPIAQNGSLLAITFLLQFLMAQLSCWLSSYMTQKNVASINFTRKFWNFLASLGFSACLLVIYFAGCNRNLSIVFATFATGFTGFTMSSCSVMPSDMTPTFSGTLKALCLTVSGMASVSLSLIVGYLTDKRQTIEQWNKIFLITIGVVMSSGIVLAIFGSAEVQPWNYVEEKSAEEKDETRKIRC